MGGEGTHFKFINKNASLCTDHPSVEYHIIFNEIRKFSVGHR